MSGMIKWKKGYTNDNAKNQSNKLVGDTDNISLKKDEKSTYNNLDTIIQYLFSDNRTFEEAEAKDMIDEYTQKNDIIKYSAFTTVIFNATDNQFQNFCINLEKLIRLVISPNVDGQVNEKVKRFVLKIQDHSSLANYQKNTIHEKCMEEIERTTKDFTEDFEKKMMEQSKENTSQLMGLMAIFTAMAFVLFGGIDSLSGIFKVVNGNVSFLRILSTVCIWSFCMLNLFYIFLLYVLKIVKNDEDGKNIKVSLKKHIQSLNAILVATFILTNWFMFVDAYCLDRKIADWMYREQISVCIIGTIFFIVMFGVIILMPYRKNEKMNRQEKERKNSFLKQVQFYIVSRLKEKKKKTVINNRSEQQKQDR